MNDIITLLHCLILHLSNTPLRQTQDRDKGQKGAWLDRIFNFMSLRRSPELGNPPPTGYTRPA
jgi:hypothetical protein